MHCMVAWGANNLNQPLTANQHQAVEAILQAYEPAFAFPGAAVITVADNPARLLVEADMTRLSQEQFAGRLVFIISPPIGATGFIYRGFLSQGRWEPINAKAA